MLTFKKGDLSAADIHQWLLALRAQAYVPESGFAVAAVFRARAGGEEDYHFGGVNVENMDHRLSTHGEEGALAALVTALGKQADIVEGWVMGAPKDAVGGDMTASCCGKCRQQIAGLAARDVKIHYVALSGKTASVTVDRFLPDIFSFRQYIPDLAKPAGGIAPDAAMVERKLTRPGPLDDVARAAWLKSLDPVDYASRVAQSVIVRLANGHFVAGTRVEEAAFVDINAVQSALALAVGLFGACRVAEAWVYTKGREEKALPAGSYGTLPLSALQVLAEFADGDITLHYMNEGGFVAQGTLAEAAGLAPVTRQAYRTI